VLRLDARSVSAVAVLDVIEQDFADDEALADHAVPCLSAETLVDFLGNLDCDVDFLNLHDGKILNISLTKCQQVS
jgi:hypothetical protein